MRLPGNSIESFIKDFAAKKKPAKRKPAAKKAATEPPAASGPSSIRDCIYHVARKGFFYSEQFIRGKKDHFYISRGEKIYTGKVCDFCYSITYIFIPDAKYMLSRIHYRGYRP
jgi:hypothetical protein